MPSLGVPSYSIAELAPPELSPSSCQQRLSQFKTTRRAKTTTLFRVTTTIFSPYGPVLIVSLAPSSVWEPLLSSGLPTYRAQALLPPPSLYISPSPAPRAHSWSTNFTPSSRHAVNVFDQTKLPSLSSSSQLSSRSWSLCFTASQCSGPNLLQLQEPLLRALPEQYRPYHLDRLNIYPAFSCGGRRLRHLSYTTTYTTAN